MSIYVTSVMVDDQAKALAFYTEKLGFVVKNDIPVGDARWLTVVSPAAPDGVELLLEPMSNPALNGAAQRFQRALFEAGIPATMFAVDDIQREYDRLTRLGVRFTRNPTAMGPVTTADLDDTCGNLIRIARLNGA
ncbi:MAG: VOC family protein [Chloroflexota bacterium]|nr:VOC family protein [Chloroflexota bacterium]